MADLVAQGVQPQHRWRRRLPPGEPFQLGRAAGTWSVGWDNRVSRQHVEICWQNGVLSVSRLPDASNPIYLRGTEVDQVQLEPGGHFVLGETSFTVVNDQVTIAPESPVPVEEQAFSPQYLREVRYRNAQQRIDVLNRLPDLIRGAGSDSELSVRLVNLLLAGIPRSDAVALVCVSPGADSDVEVLQWDRRVLSGGQFEPSRRLIVEATSRQQSLLHVWGEASTVDTETGSGSRAGLAVPTVTANANFDWAFCTPVPGDMTSQWAIYAAGRFSATYPAGHTPSDAPDLRDDLKFTESVAAVLSSLREVHKLQRQRDRVARFFTPQVLQALDQNPEVVTPRETDVTVLFCDVRGFSREAEESAADLLGLLHRVSQALGVMTGQILEHGGVFGDFQGDAAMGFWGWPIRQPDAVPNVCRAALSIRSQFEAAAQRDDDPMAGFRMGIGIATGRAVAGQIGTQDQVKVTVFGPVVNLASRLEGMTKLLHAPILLDEPTASAVRQQVPSDVARCRRLAVVQPYGMSTRLAVSELLPPESEYPLLSSEHLADYEAAVDAVTSGDWSRAYELLHEVPAADRAKDFLTGFILQHNRNPPSGWQGVIPLLSKG